MPYNPDFDPHANPRDAYYLGWAEALLFAQAHNDTPTGQATLTTHLPETEMFVHPPTPDNVFTPAKIEEAIAYVDDEGGIVYWRYHAELVVRNHFQWPDGEDAERPILHIYLYLEIASSEGHHGVPWHSFDVDGTVLDEPTTQEA